MNRYVSVAEVEKALEPYVAAAGSMTGRDITTDRTLRLAEHVGNPQDSLKVVHVAGTSGKTSTCYYIADLLVRSGMKVGLTVSPHMDSIVERVQINGSPLPEDVFCDYFSEFINVVESVSEMPTYFELMMVFAYWVFQKEKVDYAVVETGLGGLHDSSNIASRPDKLCVLTDIGLDHMHVLGRTIEEIAKQKVGIVKPSNTVVMHTQSNEVMDVVEDYVAQRRGDLVLSTADEKLLFQQRNWHLAYSVYERLRERDHLKALETEDIKQSQLVHVPGRMDIIQRNGKTIVLDGAHNEQKMSAFLKCLRSTYPGMKFPVLMALKQGKELEQLVPLIVPVISGLIATELTGSQDTPLASIPAHSIAEAFQNSGVDDIHIEHDVKKALNKLLEPNNEVVVVTGSLYLVAAIRKLLQ